MAEYGTVKYPLLTLADEVVNQNVDYDIILIQVENIREMLAARVNGAYVCSAPRVSRRAGTEQKPQCRDRFGAESIFAAPLTLN